MKILMLTPYLPYPPSSGGQVRSYNLIKHLSKHHKIYLVSLIKNDEEKKYQKDLLKYCTEIYVCKRSETPWTPQNILGSVFGKYPFLVVRNYSSEAQSAVERLLSRYAFDLIHAETFYIMPHIPATNIPILLVEQTIEYQVYQHYVKQLPIFIRPFFYFDIIKLKHWEKTFWKKANLVGAVSKEDADNMKHLISNLKVQIIPNAAGEDMLSCYSEKKRVNEPIFLYQGNFSWLQNVEAANILIKDIFPKIHQKLPSAKCIIAGQRASKKLGEVHVNGIEIENIAPSEKEKVIQVYKKSAVFLAPIKGPGGTRLKILAAMAAGLPVIATPVGVGGLAVKNGRDVLIAKTSEEFASQAQKLLSDKKLYQKIKESARYLVNTKYNWSAVSKDLEKIYKKLG